MAASNAALAAGEAEGSSSVAEGPRYESVGLDTRELDGGCGCVGAGSCGCCGDAAGESGGAGGAFTKQRASSESLVLVMVSQCSSQCQ